MDRILIVDFGSQVTQLIARRVRESGVYCEIVPFNSAEKAFGEMNPKAVILSGGPNSVADIDTPRAPENILSSGLPILGICYGQQTLCAQLGGLLSSLTNVNLAAPCWISKQARPCLMVLTASKSKYG